jgi:hypothetical protein
MSDWGSEGSFSCLSFPQAVSLWSRSYEPRREVQRKLLKGLDKVLKDFSLNSKPYPCNLISDGCQPLWQIFCLWKMKTYGKDRGHTWDYYWIDISCYVPMTLTPWKSQGQYTDWLDIIPCVFTVDSFKKENPICNIYKWSTLLIISDNIRYWL